MKRGKQVGQDETDYLLSSPKNAQRLMAGIAQLEKERTRLTLEALAGVDAGDVVDDEDVAAWIESLDTDKPLAVPKPR